MPTWCSPNAPCWLLMRVAYVEPPFTVAPGHELGYCAAIVMRDTPVTFSSTLLMRVLKALARWRWRA